MKDDNDFTVKKCGPVFNPYFKPEAEIYKCPLCKKQCYGKRKLLGHLNGWHKCDIDWNTPPNAAIELAKKRDKNKLLHINEHHTKSNFSKPQRNINSQVSNHVQEFKCPICKQIFLKENLLKNHVEQHLTWNANEVMCPFCYRKFNCVKGYHYVINHVIECSKTKKNFSLPQITPEDLF